MARKPDAAFIDRANKLGDAIDKATWDEIDKLVADAGKYGKDSVEMAYALWTKGRMARWSQERIGEGADSLDRAIALAQTRDLGPEVCSRWLRTLSVVRDDLGDAQRAIDAAERAHALAVPVKSKLHPETVAACAGLVHTMRLALHPVLPELRALAAIWPTMSEAERKVQIEG